MPRTSSLAAHFSLDKLPLPPCKPLHDPRDQPIEPHRRSHQSRRKHCLLSAINGMWAPPRYITLQPVLVRVCLPHVRCAPIDGTRTEVAFYSGRENLCKCDERVLHRERLEEDETCGLGGPLYDAGGDEGDEGARKVCWRSVICRRVLGCLFTGLYRDSRRDGYARM